MIFYRKGKPFAVFFILADTKIKTKSGLLRFAELQDKI